MIARCGGGFDLVVGRQEFERHRIAGGPRPGQSAFGRWRVQAVVEGSKAAEIQITIAPLQHPHRIVAMGLHPLHQFVLERFTVAGDAEGAVVHIASRAARDLADLVGAQGTHPRAVELVARCKGHMVHIHVQAHADGVSRHQEIHIAALIQLDLGVAGAGAERAQHHRRAAALAADQFGDAVNILGGKSHHRRTAGQAGELFRAGIGKVRKARAGDEPGLGNETLNGAAHGVAAEQHGFFQPAGMQQPVGEDMAALGVGTKLDFVDHQAGHRNVQRHRFHGADIETRIFGDDLFLARDQRDFLGAAQLDDAVKDFAGQKAQRQSDHAGFVRQHALDGEEGLAGIGGSQDRRHLGSGKGASACGVHDC